MNVYWKSYKILESLAHKTPIFILRRTLKCLDCQKTPLKPLNWVKELFLTHGSRGGDAVGRERKKALYCIHPQSNSGWSNDPTGHGGSTVFLNNRASHEEPSAQRAKSANQVSWSGPESVRRKVSGILQIFRSRRHVFQHRTKVKTLVYAKQWILHSSYAQWIQTAY